jgi:nicotinic acid mononucleotide adenylyltransferase
MIQPSHLAAAKAAIDCEALDRVLFVPAAQPASPPTGGAGAEQRPEMCRL